MTNRWKWDFVGSHTAIDVVSQMNYQYKYNDRCIPYNIYSLNYMYIFKHFSGIAPEITDILF